LPQAINRRKPTAPKTSVSALRAVPRISSSRGTAKASNRISRGYRPSRVQFAVIVFNSSVAFAAVAPRASVAAP
jgi:hypothetical protein